MLHLLAAFAEHEREQISKRTREALQAAKKREIILGSHATNILAQQNKDAAQIFADNLWGIEDQAHAIIGTSFSPAETKKGNEELENWFLRLLSPRIDFTFYTIEMEGSRAR